MSHQGSPSPVSDLTLVTVSLKLPTLWPADPELWFAQVNAQFSTFDPQYAAEVRDLILKPPDADPYDRLKVELNKRTTSSEQRRLQLLFNAEDLGDRTRFQLLRHMQQLLGGKVATFDQSLLRQLFLQRLPPNVRMVLASSKDDEDLESLAFLADKVVEVASPAVNAVQTTELSTEVEQVHSDIATLKKLVTSLTDTRHPCSFRRRTSSPAPTDRPTT
ncbi:PREDICTED: uncharacterized protein LOC100640009 [Amphimedon queenslandica]|uniref:DUF7041 domain-containing protein n=2 Tax=Amphimedon queenslandica TaxID=400682 RepID=A0AAN0IQJ6_AMPQE|nr:PREDICTED: uncharacterized protein LOC100640009 [Amphimedon queenslandica]|eukprot:XP_011407593.1 PREDICTED: uncharacterized protein LOC100640009 [Amphimedon queenslandica]